MSKESAEIRARLTAEFKELLRDLPEAEKDALGTMMQLMKVRHYDQRVAAAVKIGKTPQEALRYALKPA